MYLFSKDDLQLVYNYDSVEIVLNKKPTSVIVIEPYSIAALEPSFYYINRAMSEYGPGPWFTTVFEDNSSSQRESVQIYKGRFLIKKNQFWYMGSRKVNNRVFRDKRIFQMTFNKKDTFDVQPLFCFNLVEALPEI